MATGHYGDTLRIGLTHAVLWLTTLIMLYPIVVVALSAFKATAEIYSSPFGLPQSFNLTNLETIWRETTFPRYLANSIIVTGASVMSIVSIGTIAAYALAR